MWSPGRGASQQNCPQRRGWSDKGDERGGLNDAHLNATQRDCFQRSCSHLTPLYILISEIHFLSLNETDGREVRTYGDAEGLIEGMLGFRESLKESRILHSVISGACLLLPLPPSGDTKEEKKRKEVIS